MDLIQLEIFCRVFEERSFSRAAIALGLAQPTISIRIKEFEESLGTPLFNRLGREIEPTLAGTFLYSQALPLLEQQRVLSDRMASFLNRIDGPLVVGTSSVPAEHFLPNIVMAFQSKHPDVCVKLRFASESAQTVDELRNGRIEIGVVGELSDRDNLVAEPFGTDELVLIGPTTGPLQLRSTASVAELAQTPLILHGPGSATRHAVERALLRQKARLSDFKTIAELGRTGAIKEAVRLGYGVAFVSKRTVTTEVEAGVLRISDLPEIGSIEREISLVHSDRRELSPTAKAFLAYAREAKPTASETKKRTKGRHSAS